MEHFAIWDALRAQGVSRRYVEVLSAMYQGQQGVVVADKVSKAFRLGRGTKQGDLVSKDICNSVLREVFGPSKQKLALNGWGDPCDVGRPPGANPHH